MCSYLADILQVIFIKGRESNYYCAKSGISQGSTISPIFFAIFVNDVAQEIRHSKFSINADGLKLYKMVCTKEDAKLMQKDSDRTNCIMLSRTKCQHIKFTRKRLLVANNYYIDGTMLLEAHKYEILALSLIVG